MIFTERIVTIKNNGAKINLPIVVYRGDKNVEVRFTILQSPYKFTVGSNANMIESMNASYGQLVLKAPNDRSPIFSPLVSASDGNIIFNITAEMIDEIGEVGNYDFQIRLFDEEKTSRVTIPPVELGIEVREPIAIEDSSDIVTILYDANTQTINIDENFVTYDESTKTLSIQGLNI